MKRRSLTFFIAVVFLIWNVLTYFFVARAPNSRLLGEQGQLAIQLDGLEASIRQQIEANERLLGDLQTYRQLLLNGTDDIKELVPHPPDDQKNVGGDEEGADGGEDDVVDPNQVTLPVLVIACNRISVKRNLDQLIKYRPSAERFPIIVSQDCGHQATADTIRGYGKDVTLVQTSAQRLRQNVIARFEGNHFHHPDLSDVQLPWNQRKFQGYYKIARHYKWALQQVFHKFNHRAVIIVEDDLDISPDFFEYFAATYPILHADSTLWCVSAWNDNGKASMVAEEPELLYRTDFFPGLGWMLEKKVFLELEDKWPKTFWDDWMRHPDQRRERACIRPEISRTVTFGKVGVSRGQFFEKHLKFIKLNDQTVPFTQRDLSYLLKENYDEQFVKTVYSAPLLTIAQAKQRPSADSQKAVRVQYSDKQGFKTQAKELGIMDDLKSGVPRAGYRGVVSFILNGRRVFFAPPASWNGYDITWN